MSASAHPSATDLAPASLVALGTAALDVLMPMHIRISATGHIVSVGPTIAKLRPGQTLVGMRFLELFEVKRPLNITNFSSLLAYGSCLIRTRFREGRPLGLKGLFVAFPPRACLLSDRREPSDTPHILRPVGNGSGTETAPVEGALVNLSLGVNVVEAVQTYDLSSADFAPSDPTVDMLYLIEAKSIALEESKRLNARLEGARVAAEAQAYSDSLTGLQNRRAMTTMLNQLQLSGTPFGLMHMDLDYFKQVNDTFGHGAGDHVLRHVAAVLQDQTRGSDMVARVGGDEFVLIFRGCVDLSILDGIAWRIISKLEEPIPYEDNICRISTSIGTTLSSFYERPDADQMLNDADRALYSSKDHGRACHTVFDPVRFNAVT